jgi:carbamoyltransferase
MRILGVSNAWDAGAALIVDGRIVAAANKERFSRVKSDRCFSDRAIDFVLGAADGDTARHRVVVEWTGGAQVTRLEI